MERLILLFSLYMEESSEEEYETVNHNFRFRFLIFMSTRDRTLLCTVYKVQISCKYGNDFSMRLRLACKQILLGLSWSRSCSFVYCRPFPALFLIGLRCTYSVALLGNPIYIKPYSLLYLAVFLEAPFIILYTLYRWNDNKNWLDSKMSSSMREDIIQAPSWATGAFAKRPNSKSLAVLGFQLSGF